MRQTEKRKMPMKLLLLLLPLLLSAEMLKVGDSVASMKIEDQFGKSHKVGKESFWVVTWDKMTTRRANRFFDGHRELIAQGDAAMIVDVSQTPSGILSLFVLPRMRSYDHTILMSHDAAYNRDIPYEEEQITVLQLKAGKIAAIGFAADEAALEGMLLGKQGL
jgi:hypothetical protein